MKKQVNRVGKWVTERLACSAYFPGFGRDLERGEQLGVPPACFSLLPLAGPSKGAPHLGVGVIPQLRMRRPAASETEAHRAT